MERRGARRFTGPRALAAEGALFIAGIAAACQPQVTETPKPTTVPGTESPVPTITIAPSESPIVSPTPSLEVSPTPSATPEATPKPTSPITREGLLAALKKGGTALDKYRTTVSLSELNTEFNALMTSPSSSYIQAPGDFQDCVNTKLADHNGRATSCDILASDSIYAAEKTGDPETIAFAQHIVGYSLKNVLTKPDDIPTFENVLKGSLQSQN